MLLFEYALLRRFGLTVVVVSMFVLLLLSNNSLTFHALAWYSRSGIVSLAIVAALAAYGFYTASSTHTLFDSGSRNREFRVRPPDLQFMSG